MKRKKLFLLFASSCLILALAVSPFMAACAKPAVEPGAAEVAALQKEVAALEKKVAAAEKGKTTSEKEVAASKKEIATLEGKVSAAEKEIAKLEAAVPEPAEVMKIRMQNNTPGGWCVRATDYIKEGIEKGTDGRIQIEVIAGEAIVPSEEQLDALRDGIFQLLLGWTSYYESKIPFLQVQALADFVLRNPSDLWALYNEFGWGELSAQEYAKYNVQGNIGFFGHQSGYTIYSVVYISDWDALSGLKIRTAGFMADILEAAGASTVWIPGEEIYTGLASGLIDAATYMNPATGYDFGWHEVTNYWIRPSLAEQTVYEVIANMDFWKSLSEPDKVLIRNLVKAGGVSQAAFEENYNDRVALDLVQEAGVELIYWDEHSLNQKTELAMSLFPDWEDPAAAEAKELLIEYMRFAGYID